MVSGLQSFWILFPSFSIFYNIVGIFVAVSILYQLIGPASDIDFAQLGNTSTC